MTRVHLIYPHGNRISCPDAIGRNLGSRLEKHYEVAYHDWDEPTEIRPGPGDVLLGHVHPAPGTCFRRSLQQPGWKRVLALEPYCHGDSLQVAYLDPILASCDLFLAITGNYWFQSVEQSAFSHWRQKMIHLDLAVDRRDFPALKSKFSPPGNRRFVYIGSNVWFKNTSYLSEIAGLMPGTEFAWIGGGRGRIPGLRPLGYLNFSTEQSRALLTTFDFLITVGNADANPTTILEAMAWGLIPVCTPQSGYVDYPGIVNVPLRNAPVVVEKLRQLQLMPHTKLHEMQASNWRLLDTHFHWDRFAAQTRDAIESNARPPLLPVTRSRQFQLRWQAFVSPNSPWRPRNLAPWLRGSLRKRRASGETPCP